MNTGAIDVLVQKVQTLPDPAARNAALELAHAIMEFHAAGLDRIMEILAELDPGASAIDAVAADPLAGGILLLHDLHPLDIEARVRRALDRSEFRGRGAKVELMSTGGGMIRVRVEGGPALKTAVEAALNEAAPDAASIVVEGASAGAAGFVPLAVLAGGL